MSPENRTDKLWCVYTREYYIAVKMNKLKLETITGFNQFNIECYERVAKIT